jgi:viroplasmin and RNaseH domain-containing protein
LDAKGDNMAKKKVAYIVFKGRKPGIYQSWEECKAQIDGFSGCDHRGFNSLAEAESVWEEFVSSTSQFNVPRQPYHENYSGLS